MGGQLFLSFGLIAFQSVEASKQESKEQRRQAQATRSDMQGYWETYQNWGQEAATDYERSITSTKARMAASGVKPGSEQWETNLASITGEYEKQLEGFDTGVTGSALSDWAKGQQSAPVDGEGVADVEFTALGTTEYLTQEFGALDLTAAAPTAKEKATTTSRQAAAGTVPVGTVPAGGPTSTPWW